MGFGVGPIVAIWITVNAEAGEGRADMSDQGHGGTERVSGAGIGGLGLLAVLVTLGVLALVAYLALGETSITVVLPQASTSAPHAGVDTTVASGVGGFISGAADTVARANLAAALTVLDTEAAVAGGYGSLSETSLSAGGGAVFLTGPSTSASRISFAAVGGADGGVMLAVRSVSKTCWFVWRSNRATRYGALRDDRSCAAFVSAAAPAVGLQPGSGIDWQASSFPSA